MSFNELIFLSLGGYLAFVSTGNTNAKVMEDWGPYINTLVRVKRCEKPTVPYSKVPVAALYVESSNNTVRGNYTSYREESNAIAQIQDFYYRKGKLKPTFTLKNISCRNSLMVTLAKLMGVAQRKNSCAVPKGAYTFELDYNMLDHTLMPYSREYGRMLRRVQARSRSGTFLCYELESDIKPKKLS